MIHKGLRYFIALLSFACGTSVHLNAQLPGSMDTTLYQAEGISANMGSTFTQVTNSVMLDDGSYVAVGNFTIFGNRTVGRIVKINADGTYNNSFNTNTGTGANANINVITKQPDGKLLIGGDFTSFDGVAKNRIVRLNTDGSIDASFNIGTGCNGSVYAIFINGDTASWDSLIVVGGLFTGYNGTTLSKIVRLNYYGTRDATFSTTASGFSYLYDIAQQSSGKYIISGWHSNTMSGIKRLNVDGTLDASFNSGGLGTRGPTNNNFVNKVIIMPDDKIFAVGRFTSYSDSTGGDSTANRIVKLTADGSRDATFNGGSAFNGEVKYISLTSDNKLIVTGAFTAYKGITYNRIARIDTTGGVDSTFTIGTGISNTGMFIINAGSSRFLIGGTYVLYNNTARWGIARINNNGSLDDDFLKRSGLNNRVLDLAVQSDGKIILVGEFNKNNNDPVGYIARINLDGSLDTTFNASGAGANNVIQSIAILPNGQIIIGGNFTTYNGTSRSRLALLNDDGSLNNASLTVGVNNFVTDIKVAPDGKVYIGGNFTYYAGVARHKMLCLNPDLTINNSGIGSLSLGSGTIYTIGVQGNNKIIVSGTFTTYGGVNQPSIFRIDTTGATDSTFQKGTGFPSSSNYARAITFQKDGKILISGNTSVYNGVTKGCYFRLNADGSLDPTFTVPNTGTYWNGYDIVEIGDKIIVAGDHQTINSQSNVSLGYVKNDGAVSNEFYINGGVGGAYDRTLTVARVDNKFGRIIVAGEIGSVNGILAPQFAIFENYINELDVSSKLCSGTSAKLYYNKGVSFNSGNIFTVQLSDASGNFTSPVEIGRDTTDGWGPDSVQVSIPTGTSYGTGYRVRVVSISPVFTSLSSSPITIDTSSLTSISGDTIFCTGDTITLSVPAGGAYLWSNGGTSSSIQVSTPGTYTLTVTFSGCSATANITVTSVSPSSLAVAIPYCFLVRSDTCYTFSIDSFVVTTDSVEWSFDYTFDTTYVIANGSSIVHCVTAGAMDTVWFRPYIHGLDCRGSISYVVLMVMKPPVEVLWLNETGIIQEVHIQDKLEFTIPGYFYAPTDSVDFYYRIKDSQGTIVAGLSNVGYSGNGNYEISSLGTLSSEERYSLELVKYNGNVYSFVLIKD